MVRDDRVSYETDEDGWDEDEFADAVSGDGVEHGFHGECGEQEGNAVHEDRVVDVADEASDVEERSDSEHFGLFARVEYLKLTELMTLSLTGISSENVWYMLGAPEGNCFLR